MRAAILAAVASSAIVTVFCACAEVNTPLPTAEEGGAESKGDSGGSKSPASDGGGGGTPTGNRAPTGCLLETTGYTAGTVVESVPRADMPSGVAWTNVSNARSDDGKFASVTLAEGQESASLRVSGFGFAVPSTAETWGIEVELKRQAPGGGIEDQQINVVIEGKPSRFKFMSGPWPTSIVGTHAYGQAVDTWGVDLFPADVNKASFSATVTVKRAANATGPVTANVDSLKVAVHYCPEPVKQ